MAALERNSPPELSPLFFHTLESRLSLNTQKLRVDVTSATWIAELASGAVIVVSSYFFLLVPQRHCAAIDLTE